MANAPREAEGEWNEHVVFLSRKLFLSQIRREMNIAIMIIMSKCVKCKVNTAVF